MHLCPNNSGSDQSASSKELLAGCYGCGLGVMTVERIDFLFENNNGGSYITRLSDCLSISYIRSGEYFFVGKRAKNETEGFSQWKSCFHSFPNCFKFDLLTDCADNILLLC